MDIDFKVNVASGMAMLVRSIRRTRRHASLQQLVSGLQCHPCRDFKFNECPGLSAERNIWKPNERKSFSLLHRVVVQQRDLDTLGSGQCQAYMPRVTGSK